MRELKFRAWDKEKRKFVDFTNCGGFLTLSNDGKPFYIKDVPGFGILRPHIEDLTELIVFQFSTGLKDKNGKDIFEGDIIKWTVYGREVIALVYFDEQQACFWMGEAVNSNIGLVLNDWMRGEYEVLGNMWENPGLLEKDTP